jgi:hypothetical protein
MRERKQQLVKKHKGKIGEGIPLPLAILEKLQGNVLKTYQQHQNQQTSTRSITGITRPLQVESTPEGEGNQHQRRIFFSFR